MYLITSGPWQDRRMEWYKGLRNEGPGLVTHRLPRQMSGSLLSILLWHVLKTVSIPIRCPCSGASGGSRIAHRCLGTCNATDKVPMPSTVDIGASKRCRMPLSLLGRSIASLHTRGLRALVAWDEMAGGAVPRKSRRSDGEAEAW